MNVERLTIPSYPPLTKGRNTIVLPLGKGEVEGDENPLNPKILRKEYLHAKLPLFFILS